MGEGYVVEVKRSARRINATAGQWVADHGSRRRFSTKDNARNWAEDASRTSGNVRIQDAAPNDADPIDGYLVADPVHQDRKHTASESIDPYLDRFDD